MKRIVAVAIGILILAAPLPAGAFHELACGQFQTTVIDEKTGQRTCLALSPDAQRQVLSAKKLQQDQERRTRELLLKRRQQDQEQRTRELLLKQQQRVKQQELIAKREQSKQRQFNRRQSVRQQQSVLARDQAIKLQEGLKRQEPITTRRRELLRKSDLKRQRNLLEQRVKLPGAGLLESQKALRRRLEKDQRKQNEKTERN